MHKKIIILIIALILISGCSAPETKTTQKTITFTIPEENNVKTYVVEDKKDDIEIGKFREKKNLLNEWYYYNNLEDEEKDRLIDKRTRRWVRIIDDELIVGYDEEEDELFYKFRTIEDLKDC